MIAPTLFDVLAQVSADTPGASHRADPATAKEAARRVVSGKQKVQVLVVLAATGDHGAIPHDLAAPVTSAPYAHVVTTRLADLERLGLVKRTALVRQTPTGRNAVVWRCTAEGCEVARALRVEP